jgi:hypothetical protein
MSSEGLSFDPILPRHSFVVCFIEHILDSVRGELECDSSLTGLYDLKPIW